MQVNQCPHDYNGGTSIRTPLLDLPYRAGMAIPTSLSEDYISTNENDLERIVAWRGQHRQFTVLSNLSGRTEVLAEYQTRSSYDLAVSREGLTGTSKQRWTPHYDLSERSAFEIRNPTDRQKCARQSHLLKILAFLQCLLK